MEFWHHTYWYTPLLLYMEQTSPMTGAKVIALANYVHLIIKYQL